MCRLLVECETDKIGAKSTSQMCFSWNTEGIQDHELRSNNFDCVRTLWMLSQTSVQAFPVLYTRIYRLPLFRYQARISRDGGLIEPGKCL